MKYDLEIILPVCSNTKYIERLKNFSKIGLINYQNHKILLNFLVGSESFPKEYFFKFSENVEPRIVTSKYDHPAAKVYDFYVNYNNFDQSKWIMRIDDDSITDFSMVMNSIEDVDYNKNYFFTAELVKGIIGTSMEVLKNHQLLGKLRGRFLHEVEIALISNGCFKTIIEQYRHILLDRSKIEAGYTDQLFCYLCKISGIFPSQLEVVTSKFNLHAFLMKKVGHIHYVKNYENLFEILSEKNPIFFDKEIILEGQIKNNKSTLKLNKYGIIASHISMPQKIKSKYLFWHYRDNDETLIFYDSSLEVSKKIKLNKDQITEENFLVKILRMGRFFLGHYEY